MLNDFYFVDAHLHIDSPPGIFVPYDPTPNLIPILDKNNIRFAIASSVRDIMQGPSQASLDNLQALHETSGSRVYYLSVFDPRQADQSLKLLQDNRDRPGLLGIKLHPSIHQIPAESEAYLPAWELARAHDWLILAHTWSSSSYNPVQKLSTPLRFHRFIHEFTDVRFVMGHCGGRGDERAEAIQLLNDYANVFADFAGDIFCSRLLETLVQQVPSEKILFGSDYPWFDPAINLDRTLLADIPLSCQQQILRDNALNLFRLGQ